MKKRIIKQNDRGSKFCNPFNCRSFIYNNIEYEIPTEHVSVLLYLFLYGIASKSLWKLFKVTDKDGNWVEIPNIRICKTISRLARTKGCEHTHEYATIMDLLTNEAINNNLVIDRDDFDVATFNKWNKEVFSPWLRTFILRNYPNIINELAEIFPKIKVFC